MNSKQKSRFHRSLWPQWLAGCEVVLLEILTGMAIGWIPPFLGLLRSPNSPYEASKTEISWTASLMGFAKPLGVFSGSLAANYFGSKRGMNICILFLLTGYMCLIFANSIEVAYMTFICKGLNLGAVMSINPVYISEISAANIRGTLISLLIQGQMIGILFGNLMGTYLIPRLYAGICIAICILFVITLFFFPQTPHHLIRSKKMEQAAKSMRWYNRGGDNEKELMVLTKFLDESPKLPFFLMLKALFKNPVNRKILFKLCLFVFSLQMTGLPTMEEFMVIILTDARVAVLKPTTLVTILTLINIPMSWITMYIIDKYKRTNIYLTASCFSAISAFGLAVTYTLLDSGSTNSNIQWITITSAIIYRFSITVGMIPIFFTLMSEMFAPNIKTISIGIVLTVNGAMTFLTRKNFLFIVELLSYKYFFYMAAGIVVIHGIFVKICIPETKGKSLQEIQKMLNENSNEENDTDPPVNVSLI